ncbi:unnamed protein product [Brachionus calyciflorus]|uniref:Calpain catalytic domain-containing protein n=1 Tax=Brachionus calyciflorus TaxID=104777 RepID=A0A813UCL6_9BILA|nr:unnamed protein product [Brachionus calyciflorus]
MLSKNLSESSLLNLNLNEDNSKLEKLKTDSDNAEIDDEEFILIQKSLEEIEEENFNGQNLKQSNYKVIESKDHILINSYRPSHINLYKNQNINEIRLANKPFKDPHFPRSSKIILENLNSDFAEGLFTSLKIANKKTNKELEEKLKWKKPQVICYDKRIGKYEFVLDSKGQSLGEKFNQDQYVKYFSSDDIFQGLLGDCFMIATLLNICNNKEILLHMIPIDNANVNNMKIGAYHFRLWRLGEWYDVVIDDYLPIDSRHNPLFARNLNFPNEFWICLVEKSIAKFVGKYENLNGGHTENIATLFSGGIQNVYYSDLVKHVTSKSPILNKYANNSAKSLTDQFGSIEAGCPNIDELFFIIQYALKLKNIVGCHSTNKTMTSLLGIFSHHQYAITAAFVKENKKIIRVQNPHNHPDEIKKTKKYNDFEQRLKKQGAPATVFGEFYLEFNEFIDCFENICVYNLLPEKPLNPISKKTLTKLKKKCVKWKILHKQGVMSTDKKGAQFTINFEIKSSSSEHILLTLCQTYSSECFLSRITLHKDNQKFKSIQSQSYALQQIFNFFLDSGKYTATFEALTDIKNSRDVCARIFHPKSLNKSVQILDQ